MHGKELLYLVSLDPEPPMAGWALGGTRRLRTTLVLADRGQHRAAAAETAERYIVTVSVAEDWEPLSINASEARYCRHRFALHDA
jgi:hypothetical protein